MCIPTAITFSITLPCFDDVENGFLRFTFDIILGGANVVVFLFIGDGCWMFRVRYHIAGGLGQCPDVSGRARAWIHLAMRPGDSVDPHKN